MKKNEHIKKEVFYPAKVLLFGEYTIINGGSALAIPFERYGGHWKTGNKDTGLHDFFEFLLDLEGADQATIEQAQSEHWQFESNIPMGYGIGSSGALSAASYDRFFNKKLPNYEHIKSKLAEIESYFHGKSSGIDPFTSFINSPVVVRNKKIQVLEGFKLPPQLMLFDSQKKRNSKPLIDNYLLRLDADPTFQKAVLALGRFTERIIDELTTLEDISNSFKEISRIQFEHFSRMIPSNIKDTWESGLLSNQYYMKLTGSGGGGYFLVYANTKDHNLDLTPLS